MSTAWATSSNRQSGARIWAAWCSWRPSAPTARQPLCGDGLWHALRIRGLLVAAATGDPAVRPGRGGSSEGFSVAARLGRGGAGGWAALNPRGAREGAGGPARPTQPHAPRTCTGRLQVHPRPRNTAHPPVQTLQQHPPSATSGLPRPVPPGPS